MDNQEDPEKPWAVCPKTSLSCGFLSDRMSASIIYRGKTNSFGGGLGVVLSPSATQILCAYGGDGGTRGKLCSPPGLSSECVPGCTAARDGDDSWCNANAAASQTSSWCDGKPWQPTDLGKFMERDRSSTSYNEVVVDGFFWNEHLPHSIEAILTSPGDPAAREIHAQFLKRYGLTAEMVPLLTFNKQQRDAPFQVEVGSVSQATPFNTKNADAASMAHRGDPAFVAQHHNTAHGPATGDISTLGYGRQ